MDKKQRIAIFFRDLTEEAQKRVVTDGLTDISQYDGLASDDIRVETVTVDDDCYGYDEDPEQQLLLEHVHAETPEASWLMVWDCFAHEFQTIMEE